MPACTSVLASDSARAATDGGCSLRASNDDGSSLPGKTHLVGVDDVGIFVMLGTEAAFTDPLYFRFVTRLHAAPELVDLDLDGDLDLVAFGDPQLLDDPAQIEIRLNKTR